MKFILKSSLFLLLWQAVALPAATTVTNIAAGYADSLFLKSDGSLWAVGDNADGELGDGTFNITNRPEQIIPGGVVAIAAGIEGSSLFIKSDGSLWGMGLNTSGQLGDGTYNNTNQPQEIVSNDVVAVAAGAFHSLFIKSDGSLWAMGNNGFGQLGDGTTVSINTPEEIVASNVVAIAAGYYDSLFVKADGSLWAMGGNYEGQLGDGTSNNTDQPEEIVSNGVVAVAAGTFDSLFLKSDGSVWMMGNNTGQAGAGSRPIQIISGGVIRIANGWDHELFLKSDGSLWGVGQDGAGQLGDGFSSIASVPEQIIPLSPPVLAAPVFAVTNILSAVSGAAAGSFYSFFIRSDGSLWAMGWNGSGQLGDGTFNSVPTPEQIVSHGVMTIATGRFYSPLATPHGHSLFL